MSTRLNFNDWSKLSYKLLKLVMLNACSCLDLVDSSEACVVCEADEALALISRDFAIMQKYIKDLELSNEMACQSPAEDCDCPGCSYASQHYKLMEGIKK